MAKLAFAQTVAILPLNTHSHPPRQTRPSTMRLEGMASAWEYPAGGMCDSLDFLNYLYWGRTFPLHSRSHQPEETYLR